MARRRPRSFQTSVVTVLAAFAPLGACDSEQTNTDTEETDDGGLTSDGGLAASCPATVPADGTPCAAADESLTCVYERCTSYDNYPTLQAVCERGVYRIRRPGSCNPPGFFDGSLPDAASDASLDSNADASNDAGDGCPSVIPMEGASCRAGLDCVYETCSYGGHPTRQAICQDGSVRIVQTSCNPPPPDWSTDAGSDASLDATL